MEVKILERQRGMIDHAQLEKAVRWYASQLFSTRMANTLKLRVELRSKAMLEKGSEGCVWVTCNGSADQREFTIRLDKSKSMREMLSTLAHEMVHVEQVVSKRYQLRKWKTDGLVHARWNGEDLGDVKKIPYMDRPWEIEAFQKEPQLFTAFCKANKVRL